MLKMNAKNIRKNIKMPDILSLVPVIIIHIEVYIIREPVDVKLFLVGISYSDHNRNSEPDT